MQAHTALILFQLACKPVKHCPINTYWQQTVNSIKQIIVRGSLQPHSKQVSHLKYQHLYVQRVLMFGYVQLCFYEGLWISTCSIIHTGVFIMRLVIIQSNKDIVLGKMLHWF